MLPYVLWTIFIVEVKFSFTRYTILDLGNEEFPRQVELLLLSDFIH